MSSPSLIYVNELGRDAHTLSRGELVALIHALHLPELVDIHEQRMLHIYDSPHPLDMHPLMAGQDLPFLKGTLSICDELAYRHPIARDDTVRTGEMPAHIYFPYVGDLLLIIRDGSVLRCVNWTIKRSTSQHGTADAPSEEANPDVYRTKSKAYRRLLIETLHYASGRIPTYPIAFDNFDRIVTGNLLRLYFFASQAPEIDEATQSALTLHIRAGIAQACTLNTVMSSWSIKHRVSLEIARSLVFKAMWKRWVRVDLFSTIFPDRVLRPETKDLVAMIRSKWLGELTCN
jgi:hypothetical protein